MNKKKLKIQNKKHEIETKETLSLLRSLNKVPDAKRKSLEILLSKIPGETSPYVFRSTFSFVSKIRYAVPVGVVVAVLLMISVFNPTKNEIALAPVNDTANPQATNKDKVDNIVKTAYQNSANEKISVTTKTAQDKTLALQDKAVLDTLSTNYDNAF
jgi:hypothetical protein